MSLRKPTPRHWAELSARQYLEARGFEFVAGNHTERSGELDLVMRQGGVIVFVEVRQRSRQDYGTAAETISPLKLQRLRRTAELFLLRKHGTVDLPCRFDAVLLTGTQARHTLQHLEGIS